VLLRPALLRPALLRPALLRAAAMGGALPLAVLLLVLPPLPARLPHAPASLARRLPARNAPG
jgi:hypothetical protein